MSLMRLRACTYHPGPVISLACRFIDVLEWKFVGIKQR
ncbi:protein of unknown function [Pararobbsia alpina]